MTWARLDDRYDEHPKVVRLSDAAFRLHVRSILYCARNLTDGHLPPGADRQLGATPKTRRELTATGLWDKADEGYQVHDYLTYNPSRDDVISGQSELSRKRAEAGRIGGQRSAESRKQNSKQTPQQKPKQTPSNRKQLLDQTDSKQQAPYPDPPATDFANAQSAAAAAPDAEALGTLRVAIGGIVDRDPTLLDECQQLASEYSTEQLVAAIAECRRTRGADNRFLRPYPGNLRRFLPDLAPSSPQRTNDPSGNLPDAADLFANVLAKKRAKDAAAAAAKAAEEARS